MLTNVLQVQKYVNIIFNGKLTGTSEIIFILHNVKKHANKSTSTSSIASFQISQVVKVSDRLI